MTIQPGPFEQASPFQQLNPLTEQPFGDPSRAVKQSLKSNVGEISPALFAAGARTNLTREERNLIETWSSIKGTHEKLMKMNNKKASESFKKLSKEDQETLTAYYKVDYANKAHKDLIVEDPAIRKLFGLDNGFSPGDLFKSPLRALMGAAGQYGRAFNTPYTMAQQAVTNRENFWSRSNFEMSFDGDYSYDENLKEQLENKHGKELGFVAMHLLAGKTPGEIIDAWGPNDGAILEAVNQVFNEPDKIAGIMDEFDRARLSPGRHVARWVNKTFDRDAEQRFGLMSGKTAFKGVSGTVDLAFQIFADPLTYLTAGRSTIFKANRLTKALETSRDVVAHFADPSVARYFEGFGERIGEYAAASKAGNAREANKLKDQIQSRYPQHGTPEEIKFWADLDVTDFNSFKSKFTDEEPQAFAYLTQGRVVGVSFAKNGAVYAKPTREITLKAKEKVKEVFRGKAAFDQLDEAGTTKLLDELGKADGANYSDIEKTIQDATGTGVKRFLKRLEYQFSLHPGSKGVRTDERFIDTIETLKQQANLVFKNKVLAGLYTEHFISSTQAERILLKKNLDILTFRSAGIHGLPGGQKYIDAEINSRYGDGLFGVRDELAQPAQFGTEFADGSILGPIQPAQLKDAISPINWRLASQFVAYNQLRADKKLDVATASRLIGGAYNSKVVAEFMDKWSLLTLFPQLGIRSGIDEGFLYTLTATAPELREFVRAQKYGKSFTAATGSNKSIGPIKNTLQGGLSKLTGRGIGPVRTISKKERDDINAQVDESYYDGNFSNRQEANDFANREFMKLAVAKYGDNLDDASKEYLYDLGQLNPQYLADSSALKIIDATLNQTTFRSSEKLISKKNSDKSLDDAMLTPSGLFEIKKLKHMPDETVDAEMFHHFITRFNQNGFEIGGKKNPNTNPARLFIANNGLKTTQDVDRAVFQFLEAVGFRFNDGAWSISNKKVGDVQKFINTSTHFAKFDGLSDVKKVEGFIRDTFKDLYVAFHGDVNQFNANLIKVFQPFINGSVKNHRDILDKIIRNEDVLFPSGKINIPSYSKLIKNHKPKDEIVSDLTDVKLGFEGNFRKWGDGLFEGMARQNDDMVRVPIVQAHYVLSRRQNATQQTEYANAIAQKLIKQGVDPANAATQGRLVSKEFFTTRALTEATNRVLKYADNPDVRTVFAYNIRTVGRFYRAVEDFHRRMYRLVKENKLNTIYRMRLLGQGLDATGDVHQDTNGERYVVLPMDDVIYGAVDGTLRMLTNDEVSVRQPLFNDITFNLTAGNPSFQTDAGVPYLSGPAGSISVLAVKSLLGNFSNSPKILNAAEDLDQWTLGSMGDNVTLKGSLTPKFVNNIWKMLSPDERSQQEVSAYMQALAYNQANDLGINPEDYYDKETKITDQARLDEDKRNYLQTIKISAHNIIVTRALLGMILPFAVQTKDTKDLPTYLKETGIVSMKSSFYEVLDQVKLKYPDVDNHYELALATWMGKNPGKIAYLVSTDQETVKPLIAYSNEMQDWAITNAKDIEKYGNGALMFAPNTGEFSPGVYKWAEASGIVNKIPENKTATGYIEDYYQDLMLKEYVNAYYDIQDQEAEDLRNVPFESADLRRASLKAYEDWRKEYKIGVPGLEDYIASGKDDGDASDFIQSAYNYVNSPNADVKPDVKQKVNEAYTIFNEFIEYANYINSLDPSGAADMKRVKKAEAQEKIKKLIAADTSKTIEQYYKYGLLKMMNAKSRDAQPSIGRNVVKKVGN